MMDMAMRTQNKTAAVQFLAEPPEKRRHYMRITEALRSILNKFLHRSPKKALDGIHKASEPITIPEKPLKPVRSEYDRQQKLIRRYRVYAFHHKKKRIRKKYMKKLLELSPVDRLFFRTKRN
jgi:hypothetical protein|nr:MAG TPA: hypothetical protein [Caudoviricetes sp.]